MPDAQTCFYRGQTLHTRLTPARHAFRYRLFFLCIPLRTLGSGGFGTRLFKRNRFAPMAFYDCDHGDGKGPALAWIERILGDNNIHDADGEIWLQTFPRLFGYVFNPVSFWFCHRRDGALRAILCEVSNTFGERHCYLLRGTQSGHEDAGPAKSRSAAENYADITWGTELQTAKDFHVSPFNPVKGTYRFRFFHGTHGDLIHRVARIAYSIDGTETLHASISGVTPRQMNNPDNLLSDRLIASILLHYPLMTLAIMARIHWQALRLFIRRIPFFRKPAPPHTDIST